MEVYDQFKLIHDALAKPSTCIIVLDACRYDYFWRVYRDYLDGRLLKAWSRGSCTIEWLMKTFIAWYNVTYVSANGFVLPNAPAETKLGTFNAPKKFKRIVSPFLTDWDDKLGTVPPDRVVEKALKNIDSKMIVHFIQPHFPCIGEPKLLCNEKEATMKVKSGDITVEYLRSAYEGNLRLVLRHVKELIDMLPHENVIVTSDHGEVLFEKGYVNHPCGSNDPLLREVPWLVVR